jgi:hypothetical protein
MPEGRFTTKAQGESRNAGERQARRLAGRNGGDEGLMPSVERRSRKAAGGSSGSKERKL